MALPRAREAVMNAFSPALLKHQLSPQQWPVIRAPAVTAELDAAEITARCALLVPSLSRTLQNLHRRGLAHVQTSTADA